MLHNSLENLISQLLDTTDLWFDFRNNISSSNIDSYASLDTSYRQQLRSLFTQTEDSLISLSSVEFKEGLSDQEMQSKLDQLETYFNTAENYIDTLESLLRKTVVSSSVTESFLSSQKQQQISYRSQFLSLHSQFLSFDTSVDSFLSLYQSSQDTLAKQVAIAQLNHDNLFVNTASNLKTAQINYQRSSIDLEKREDQLQLALADATTARNTAQSNHDSAIYSAQLSVSDARSALEQTTRNYNKSIVKAPISGEIFQITADIGQTVSPSQKLLSIVDTQDVSVDIMLPKKQYDQLVIGDRVTVDVQGSVSTGIVSTLSSVADTNLQYKVTITLENADLDTVGILAKVYLLLNSEYVLLPVNTLMPVSSSLADVYIYNFGIVEKKSLQLGKTYNSLVEVYTPLDTNFEIITSDMSRYRDGMEITKLTPQK
ncbi:MAG: HlyD family efflux transporter periplasmic adaptor subunit [Patescibacteria group bacterium]|nr:HlyD family efflux transporter periplasmic adaptor subunit [Patescibacteria group bacterium]